MIDLVVGVEIGILLHIWATISPSSKAVVIIMEIVIHQEESQVQKVFSEFKFWVMNKV
jgi:hypothetical protein